MAQTFDNYINGNWVSPDHSNSFENRNPAITSDLIGLFPLSSADDVDAAAKSARGAFAEWRLIPAPKRGDFLRIAGDLLSRHKESIAREMTREMGKPFIETKGDVQEAIDTAYYAATEGRRLFGRTVPSELPNKFNMSVRHPVGVCGIITAWNFPVAVPSWKIFPALVAGNTIVFKPSEHAPMSGMLLTEILEEAGFPPGVINLVHGNSQTGRHMVEHTLLDAVAFTGSVSTGTSIAETCGRLNKRVSLEMGGKNPMIVMDDAQAELVVEGLLWGAFGTTGQRCTATSRLIVHDSLHDHILELLLERTLKLKLGYANEEGIDVGPLINQAAVDKVEHYIESGRNEGATLRCGGRRATGDGLNDGYFFEPTIFTGVTRRMAIAREEIFGPVLSVLKIRSLEEAIDIANDVPYGLSSSIYTQDINSAFRAMRDLQSGITYINGPTIGAEAHMPFGGVKNTGNGHRDGGWEVFEFFTETRTVYVDFSGRLQKAQIDV